MSYVMSPSNARWHQCHPTRAGRTLCRQPIPSTWTSAEDLPEGLHEREKCGLCFNAVQRRIMERTVLSAPRELVPYGLPRRSR